MAGWGPGGVPASLTLHAQGFVCPSGVLGGGWPLSHGTGSNSQQAPGALPVSLPVPGSEDRSGLEARKVQDLDWVG